MDGKVGDRISCWIDEDHAICPFDAAENDEFVEGTIIRTDLEDDFLPYAVVFDDQNVRHNNGKVGTHEIETYSLPNSFLGKKLHWVPVEYIKEIIPAAPLPTVQVIAGSVCIHCHEYCEYSVPNLRDNKFLCFSCRSSEAWRYQELM